MNRTANINKSGHHVTATGTSRNDHVAILARAIMVASPMVIKLFLATQQEAANSVNLGEITV